MGTEMDDQSLVLSSRSTTHTTNGSLSRNSHLPDSIDGGEADTNNKGMDQHDDTTDKATNSGNDSHTKSNTMPSNYVLPKNFELKRNLESDNDTDDKKLRLPREGDEQTDVPPSDSDIKLALHVTAITRVPPATEVHGQVESTCNSDTDTDDDEFLISPEEEAHLAAVLQQRKEEIFKQQEQFDEWHGCITKRRMFAQVKAGELNKSHNERIRFYTNIHSFLEGNTA